ncbi:hypothetical protein NMY22_g13291 [Coprinellus aureogranulatus]|nr:hypothetical protein NMY22_g13291 [Coprinellus aureogranulatus]
MASKKPSASQVKQYTCPHCPQMFALAGTMANHAKACARKQAQRESQLQWDEGLAGRKADPQPRQRRPWEQAGSFDHSANSRANAQEASSSRVPNPPPPSSSPSNIQQAQPMGDDSRFSAGTIKVEYPANRKRKPDIFENQTAYNENKRPKQLRDFGTNPPWHPFKTRSDYDFAELVFRAAMTKEQITSLLAVVNRCIDGKDKLSFSSYADVHDSLSEARHLVEPFEKSPISEEFEGEIFTYDLWKRDIWDWVKSLVTNENLVHHFRWDAETVLQWIDEEEQSRWERCYGEPWTGSHWHEAQRSVPKGSHVICIILYADKTQLSSFGTAKAYPVYAKIGNLPSEIRNGKGIGGGCIVGWLPIVDDDPRYKKKPEWVDFKRIIWHSGVEEILASLVSASEDGDSVRCGDGVQRNLFPIVMILSADYEEQVVMAGIRGIRNKWPCPVCLVPKDELAQYANDWVYRDGQQREELVSVALDDSKTDEERGEAEAELAGMGFRIAHNALSTIANADVHQILRFDRLHNYPGALAKTHILPLIMDPLNKKNKEASTLKQEVERRAANFPRWSNLTHFSTILTNTSYQDSNKWEDTARILLYATHCLFDHDKEMKQALRLLRVFLNLNTLSSFERHTDSTLAIIDNHLKKFFNEIEKHQKVSTVEKNWNVPKVHLHVHMLRDIMAIGVTRNYTTKTFEGMHKPLKEFYRYMTNFKNVASQVLSADHISMVLDYIKAELEAYEEAEREEARKRDAQKDEADSAGSDSQAPYAFGNVIFKAPVTKSGQRYTNFTFNSQDIGPYEPILKDFNFTTELTGWVEHHRQEIEGALKCTLQETDPLAGLRIQVFRTVKVLYKSLETGDMEENLLRCSPQFHGQPRFDAVMINTDEKDIYGRLLYLFVLKVGKDDEGVPVALAIPYDGSVTKQQRRKDTEMGFHRVRPPRTPTAEFFFARQIIRGTLLVEAGDIPTDYLVFDVLDGDMHLRTQESIAEVA